MKKNPLAASKGVKDTKGEARRDSPMSMVQSPTPILQAADGI